MARTKEEIGIIVKKLLAETYTEENDKEKTILKRGPLDISDIPGFIRDIDIHIKAIKYQGGNSIDHCGFSNQEIPEFITDVFPEIVDINGFLSVLEIFGLDRNPLKIKKDFFTDLFVLFDKKKSGFIMVQESFGLNSFQKSNFCLMYQRGKDENPVINIAGVNNGRILTTEYVYSKEKNEYSRKKLSIGIDSEEERQFIPPSNLIKIKPRYLVSHAIITDRMLKKAPFHESYIDFRDQPVFTNLEQLNKLSNIPQNIATN